MPITEYRSTYRFSSALTELDDGRFDEDLHREAIMPIRAKLMSIDGMSGCHIARYGVEVAHLADIIGSDTVDPHVQECFEWARREHGFFPLLDSAEQLTVTRTTGHIEQMVLTASPPRPSKSQAAEIKRLLEETERLARPSLRHTSRETERLTEAVSNLCLAFRTMLNLPPEV